MRCAGALIVITCAALVAACGASSKSAGSASAGKTQGIAFADCMRSHGVPNFPDSPGGGGIKIPLGSGINPQSPAFRSAMDTCQKLLPAGGPGRGPASEARKEQIVKLAECMRAHGLTTFPDPTTSAPSAPPAGGGIAFGAPGAFLSVPQTMINSPGFKQAASACSFPGFGGGGNSGAKVR